MVVNAHAACLRRTCLQETQLADPHSLLISYATSNLVALHWGLELWHWDDSHDLTARSSVSASNLLNRNLIEDDWSHSVDGKNSIVSKCKEKCCISALPSFWPSRAYAAALTLRNMWYRRLNCLWFPVQHLWNMSEYVVGSCCRSCSCMTQNTQNSDDMHKRIKDQSWLAQAGKSASYRFTMRILGAEQYAWELGSCLSQCLSVALCFEVLILAGMSGRNDKNNELISTPKVQNKKRVDLFELKWWCQSNQFFPPYSIH